MDGLALSELRHAKADGFDRFRFELRRGAYGRDRVSGTPRSEVEVMTDPPSLRVTLHGVRWDLTGNLPLQNESGRALGEPTSVPGPTVRSYGRELTKDDSAVVYRFTLSRPAPFRLFSRPSSSHITLDVGPPPPDAASPPGSGRGDR
jgi:hypothetical protein